MKLRTLVGVCVVFLAEISHAVNEQKVAEFVLCRNQKTVRTIRVMPVAQAPGGCTVTYTKNGIEERVGTNRMMSSCLTVVSKIRTNLENSSWKCRSISQVSVTESDEVVRQ